MPRSVAGGLTLDPPSVSDEVPADVVESFERVLVASREADNVPRDILRRLDLRAYGSASRLRSHLECLRDLTQTLIDDLHGQDSARSERTVEA